MSDVNRMFPKSESLGSWNSGPVGTVRPPDILSSRNGEQTLYSLLYNNSLQTCILALETQPMFMVQLCPISVRAADRYIECSQKLLGCTDRAVVRTLCCKPSGCKVELGSYPYFVGCCSKELLSVIII